MQNTNETFQTLMNTNELPRLESYLTRIKETLAQWYPYVKEEKKNISKTTVVDKAVQNKIT